MGKGWHQCTGCGATASDIELGRGKKSKRKKKEAML